MAFTKASLASALAPAGSYLSPPSIPFPDSLDAHNSRSGLLPSSPPRPLPQRRPRKAVATASTKASSAPRKYGLLVNISAEQLQVSQMCFERGMTNGSSRTVEWRWGGAGLNWSQYATGECMHKHVPHPPIKRYWVTNICTAKNPKNEERLQH